MATQITGTAGLRTERTQAYRRIRKSDQGAQYLEGGITIDGTYSGDAGNTSNVDVLRPGKIMVKAASGGLYRNLIIGKTTAAYVDNDTTLTVGAATATEVARLIAASGAAVAALFVGPPTAAGTNAATVISMTAASGTTITIADLNLGKVSDSLIILAAAAITPNSYCLIDDGDGVKLSDEDGNRTNQSYGRALTGGSIDSSQIIDWPADTSTIAYLVGLLNNANNNNFRFDHAF